MNIEKEHFEQFLYSQPRDRKVNLDDGTDCLLCQFIKETTPYKEPVAGWNYFHIYLSDLGCKRLFDIPEWFHKVVRSGNPITYRTTYGKMQDKFRAVFPKETEPEPVAESCPA